MYFHLCPTEIAAFVQLYEVVSMYAFHYKHIIVSFFMNWYDKDCEVCND
jgi:hypothetical protein